MNTNDIKIVREALYWINGHVSTIRGAGWGTAQEKIRAIDAALDRLEAQQQPDIAKLIEAGDALFEWVDGAHLDADVSFTKRAEEERGPILEAWHAAKSAAPAQQPRVRYRSKVSGMWYETLEAAGDVDCVEVDGVQFCQENGVKCLTQQQSKRLTDEEIEANAARLYPVTGPSDTYTKRQLCRRHGYVCGMKDACDLGYLGGLSVDEVMQVHRKWMDEMDCYDDWNPDAFEDLRARLTAKLNGTLS